MKRVFVVNPRAGGGARRRWLEDLQRYFHRHGAEFEALLCRSREETIDRTRQALETGAEQVVAVGGDGTMNAVLQGFFADERLVRPEASLAVARVGTGSDYFRTVSGNRRLDWRQIVLDPRLQPVDVGVFRRPERPQDGPRYFLNMTGFGLSADVVERKERLPRWLPRSLCYLVPTLASYLSVRPWRVRIWLDDELLERELLSLIVSKGIYAGGGMRFGGQVALDDGWLEVTVFRPLSLAKLLLKTPKLYRGDYAGEPSIEKFQARRVRIECLTTIAAESDGELVGTGSTEVALVPRSLQVCFPRQAPV